MSWNTCLVNSVHMFCVTACMYVGMHVRMYVGMRVGMYVCVCVANAESGALK